MSLEYVQRKNSQIETLGFNLGVICLFKFKSFNLDPIRGFSQQTDKKWLKPLFF